jgi:hypothetical protein
MKTIKISSLLLIVLTIIAGCKKSDNNSAANLNDSVTGIYHGTFDQSWKSNYVNGTCELIKAGNNTVNIKLIIDGIPGDADGPVYLSNATNGGINIAYSKSGISLTGTIINNKLEYTSTFGDEYIKFSGRK